MSQYVQQVWEDRIVEYPNRYKDQNGNILTLTEFPGNVAKTGTLVEAAKMNNIENGIANLYNAFKIVKTNKTKITSTYNPSNINYPAGMNKNNCFVLNFKVNIYDENDNLVKSFSRWSLSGQYENSISYSDNGIGYVIFLDESDVDTNITDYYIEVVFLLMNKNLDFSSIVEENDFVTDVSFNNKSLEISFLNKEKKYINFNDFVKNNEYATGTTGGVIKTGNCFDCNFGIPSCTTKTYDDYEESENNIFISKGTLKNVLSNKIGDISSILDSINGEVV